jgi:hypothetical protein
MNMASWFLFRQQSASIQPRTHPLIWRLSYVNFVGVQTKDEGSLQRALIPIEFLILLKGVVMQTLINTCTDGNFSRNAICLEWVNKLSSHIKKVLGLNFRTRIYAYERAAWTYLAVDLFGKASNDAVSITICLSGDTIELNSPDIDELYIEVPGILDALTLIRQLLTLGQGTSTSIPGLWILSSDA